MKPKIMIIFPNTKSKGHKHFERRKWLLNSVFKSILYLTILRFNSHDLYP